MYQKESGKIVNFVRPTTKFSPHSNCIEWKKLLDESEGLCGALIKDNDDSKKILSTQISNIKCGINGSTWIIKTSHGEERVSVKKISDAVRFQTSLYSIDISPIQSGVFFSQPMTASGVPFSVGDLKTNQIADFYSKNLALCSKPTGVENINRCKLGEDLILNLQILPKVLEKCSDRIKSILNRPTDKPRLIGFC